MKRFLISLAASCCIAPATALKAEAQAISSGELGISLAVGLDSQANYLNLYKISSSGTAELLQRNIFPERTLNTFSASQSIVDTSTGKMYLREPDQGQGARYRVYNAATNEFEGYTSLDGLPSGQVEFLTAPVKLNSIARREGDELHIGENSFITREANGTQEIYAQDANGNPIPLNVTNGSDLQINGRSVQGQIDENRRAINKLENNVGNLGSGVAGATALSAALSALPSVSDDTPFSCGVGTGGYSSRFAMGIGCAARLNERFSVNAGGSHVFGGASDYGQGTLDTIAARAGFVFKIGRIHQPTTSAASEQLKSKLKEVEKNNLSMRRENNELRARLDRLEALALNFTGQQLKTETRPQTHPTIATK